MLERRPVLECPEIKKKNGLPLAFHVFRFESA